jgi:rubredoxin
MQKYICVNCGYIYDPQQGDPMNNIAPGTAFSALPKEWVCPICYAGQDMFDALS